MTYKPIPTDEITGNALSQDEGTQRLLEELIEVIEKLYIQLTLITDSDLDEI